MFVFFSAQDIPDPEKPEDWQFHFVLTYKGEKDHNLTNAERLKIVKEKGAMMAEPFRSAILWFPENQYIPLLDIGSWLSEPWDSRNGRVTLAADAAHPMPPYRGQGLNHAIQDASNIVRALSRLHNSAGSLNPDCDGQAELVQSYSDEVAKRGAEEVMLSRKNGYMLVGYHDFMNSPYAKQGLSRQQ